MCQVTANSKDEIIPNIQKLEKYGQIAQYEDSTKMQGKEKAFLVGVQTESAIWKDSEVSRHILEDPKLPLRGVCFPEKLTG